MEKCLCRKWPVFVLGPCVFLDVSPEAHRRVFRDMRKAFAMMALFFPVGVEKYVDDYEDDLTGHMIINQGERAKNRLNRRTPQSNKHRRAEFWKELDGVRHKFYEGYPEEWDQAIRPVIAKCKMTLSIGRPKYGFSFTDAWSAQYIRRVFSVTLTYPSWQDKPSLIENPTGLSIFSSTSGWSSVKSDLTPGCRNPLGQRPCSHLRARLPANIPPRALLSCGCGQPHTFTLSSSASRTATA